MPEKIVELAKLQYKLEIQGDRISQLENRINEQELMIKRLEQQLKQQSDDTSWRLKSLETRYSELLYRICDLSHTP